MDKAVFKNCFRYHAGAFSNAHQHHKLGLHIRRKARVGLGFNVHTGHLALDPGVDGLSCRFNFRTGQAQLVDQRSEMIRFAIQQRDTALGQDGSHHKGSGFDSIRNDLGFNRFERGYPVDCNDRSPGTLDIGAHFRKRIRQGHNFRFTRGIAQDRGTFRRHRRHHQVLGSGDGDGVKVDIGPLQSFGGSFHISVLQVDRGAERGQAL